MSMLERRLTILLILSLVSLCSCPKRQATPTPASPQDALAEALAAIRNRQFARAQNLLTDLVFNHTGSLVASDAQFYLAESYYESGDFSRAQTEYDFYIQNFPAGRFQEEARLKQALAYLRSAPSHTRDQSRVIRARELLEDFVADHPNSPLRHFADSTLAAIRHQLVQREFEAARLYFRAGEYGSALVYYEYISQTFPESLWQQLDRRQLETCRRTKSSSRPPVSPSSVHEVLYFDRASHELSSRDSAVLSQIIIQMKTRDNLTAVITGHCDSAEAADPVNSRLGLLRGTAVRTMLVTGGIDSSRISVVDAGASARISASSEESAIDRRVELFLR